MATALDASLRPSMTQRFAAFLVDEAFLALVLSGVQAGFRIWGGERLAALLVEGPAIYRWDLLTMSIPAWSYFIISESLTRTTLGKRLMGIEVRAVGEPLLGVAAVLRRTAVKLLPFELAHVGIVLPEPIWRVDEAGFRWPLLVANILLATYLWALLKSSARQAPHDRAAGTVVVRRV